MLYSAYQESVVMLNVVMVGVVEPDILAGDKRTSLLQFLMNCGRNKFNSRGYRCCIANGKWDIVIVLTLLPIICQNFIPFFTRYFSFWSNFSKPINLSNNPCARLDQISTIKVLWEIFDAKGCVFLSAIVPKIFFGIFTQLCLPLIFLHHFSMDKGFRFQLLLGWSSFFILINNSLII
jgi:hypothetical protein